MGHDRHWNRDKSIKGFSRNSTYRKNLLSLYLVLGKMLHDGLCCRSPNFVCRLYSILGKSRDLSSQEKSQHRKIWEDNK